jgi:hypothetical protein
MRVLYRILGVCALAMLLPGMAYAQASIAGVVRDASGAVIPGVTVEAASPALIEKVRTVVTDGSGQYRIIELRPGAYTVTFTLAGFNTVKREGIELEGTFVATVNAEMRVGALEETITVTGAASVVDTQSARQQAVMSRDVVRDIPTSRSYFALAVLIPGVNTSQRDVGGTSLNQAGNYTIHGGRNADGRVSVDGVTVGQRGGNPLAPTDEVGANMTMYQMNAGLMQETAISTSGGLGEAETGGILVNMVPREGGNTLRGSFYGTWGNDKMQGSNYDDRLRSLGLRAPNEVLKVWEVSGQVGGPVIQDRLWYVLSGKHTGTENTVAGMYYNLNAGDVTKWNYEPDFSRQAFSDDVLWSTALRLTYQMTPRNKFNVFWDEQRRTTNKEGGGASTNTSLTAPEASNIGISWPSRAFNSTWSSPVTNRLLLEAGYGGTFLQWGGKAKPGYTPELIRVVEQAGAFPNLTYRGQQQWNSNFLFPTQLRGSLSYVTGSHSAKFGGSRTWNVYDDRYGASDINPIQYRFSNGVPNQLTITDNPRYRQARVYTGGLYAQDSWIIQRLTVQGGLRFDTSHAFFPEQYVGGGRYNPTRIDFARTEGAQLWDISPRVALSYDVRGDGKTAVKMTLGKYMQATELFWFGELTNPTLRIATSTTRSWSDADRDFNPDCDLLNSAANGECGAYANLNFGTSRFSQNIDQDIMTGSGHRQYNWEWSGTVQHELMPRVGLNFGVFRRTYGNFLATDNLATTSADYTRFSLTAPSDPRLPGGGGYTLTNLYNVNPAQFGQTSYFITSDEKYADAQKDYWTGYDFNVTVRAVRGFTASGGLSTGRQTKDTCALKELVPEFGGNVSGQTLGETDPWCLRQEKFQTQYKGLASYILPKIDVLVSGTFQSALGPVLAANFNAPNAVIQPSLGRPLSGGAANVQVNLVEPGQLFGERINQVDLRFAKVLNFRGTRTNVGLDLFNALNTNTPTAYNQTYGPSWLTPTTVLPARFIKVSAQLDF